jgi:hypothetical protein
MFGGALGLAILATLATSRTSSDLRHPTAAVHTVDQALVNGFQFAFAIGAAMAFVGALVAIFGMPSVRRAVAAPAAAEHGQPAVAVEA